MAVLVDSSVWIAGASPKNAECVELKRMITANELIYTALPIQVEVCQGARSELDFHKLWDSFKGFRFLETPATIWEQTAWNYYRCRKRGITLTTIDCLIATLAKENRVPLWTLDKIFIDIAPIIGFDLQRT